jgi:hypothetical protein
MMETDIPEVGLVCTSKKLIQIPHLLSIDETNTRTEEGTCDRKTISGTQANGELLSTAPLTYPVSQISSSDHAGPSQLHDDCENVGQSIESESEEPLLSEDERDSISPKPVSEEAFSFEESEGKSCSRNETLDYDKYVSDTSQSQLEDDEDEDNVDDDYRHVNVFSDSEEEKSAPVEGQQDENLILPLLSCSITFCYVSYFQCFLPMLVSLCFLPMLVSL